MNQIAETRRRVLLGGAGLASVAMFAPGAAIAAAPATSEWTQAVTDWKSAHATVRRYNAVPGGVTDEMMDQATSDEHDAAYRLAALPAADRAAVGIKLNALLDFFEGCKIDVATLRMIAADALRTGEA